MHTLETKKSSPKPTKKASIKRTAVEENFRALFVEKSAQSEIKQLPVPELEQVLSVHWLKTRNIKKTPFSVSVSPVKGNGIENEIVGNTQIDVVSHDMAFIVDSVTAELSHQGFNVVFLIHPLMDTEKPTKGSIHRAHLHIRISNLLPKAERQKLKTDIEKILTDILWATKDWLAMKDMVRYCQKGLNNAPSDVYPEELIEDNLEFLEYLHRNNFTLLGYREYKFNHQKDGSIKSKVVRKSSLGLLRDERMPVFVNHKDISLPEHLQELRKDLPPVYVSKINKLSTVHRKVPLDCINIKLFDKKGKLVGEGCLLGLFASVTYNQSLRAVPFLRYKAEQVMEKSGYPNASHDYRVLRHVLEKYPRDELFQISIDQLCDFSDEIVKLQDYKRLALFMRNDPFERSVSCLIYVPKERWDTRLRLKFREILESHLKGTTVDFALSIDDSPLARLSFVVLVEPFHLQNYDKEAIEHDLRVAAQNWVDQLQSVVYRETGSDKKAYNIVQKYRNSFSGGYQDRYEALESYRDILKIEEATETKCLALDLVRGKSACDVSGDTCHINLKFYNPKAPIELSAVFPIIENMGFYVTSEIPSEVKFEGEDSLWTHNFELLSSSLTISDKEFKARKKLFEQSFLDVYENRTENDYLNQLTLKEGLSGRDIVILRTVLRYLRQTIYTYSKTFSEQVVTQNSKIARLLVQLFKVQHDPDYVGDREKSVHKIEGQLKKEFKAVKSIDHDHIMRLFWNVMSSILRTNFFQKNAQGGYKDCVSIKLDSANIGSLPDPKPYREIFVYSRRIEGVHLRGDAIARGGLRWSDRHEDFRTEVLGLMKAQMVKNAVIVPMGSKGGFVVKNPPKSGDRQAFLDEGIACYKIFIQALLDVTDNVVNQKIVPPKNVVRWDGDDPYLVVAADKGTATFSDIANGISQANNFWLDDAFASGGSAGYDHKVMGITARGAWESVKRHFNELGHDTQTQDFDVMGVGDMGGDVFGNGMLLSKHIRLVGAFNHLHIFCDPEPDSAKSWKERKRLFGNVQGWDHYNTELLS
ncbi:MAG: NAD-glutamate dehydrogenase, partial [Alphaproteobacteria bacterium]|nr:NAD-glutamate dehydrogenase [Alphaproteobacteria bacterium]